LSEIPKEASVTLFDFYVLFVAKWQKPSCFDGKAEGGTTPSVDEPVKVKDQPPVDQDQLSVEESKVSIKFGNLSSSQEEQYLIKSNQELNQKFKPGTPVNHHTPATLLTNNDPYEKVSVMLNTLELSHFIENFKAAFIQD